MLPECVETVQESKCMGFPHNLIEQFGFDLEKAFEILRITPVLPADDDDEENVADGAGDAADVADAGEDDGSESEASNGHGGSRDSRQYDYDIMRLSISNAHMLERDSDLKTFAGSNAVLRFARSPHEICG